jgi:hypothetical protein
MRSCYWPVRFVPPVNLSALLWFKKIFTTGDTEDHRDKSAQGQTGN